MINDRISPEEIREENEYQQKWGDDPNMVKAPDEDFSKQDLERPIVKEKRVWTSEKQAHFDDFWKDLRWFLGHMAQSNGQILTEEHYRIEYQKHLNLWKSNWERE